MRGRLLLLLPVLGAVALAAGPAAADSDPLTFVESPESLEPAPVGVVLETAALPLGQTLPAPDVVTDEELAGVGSTPLIAVPAQAGPPDFVVDDDLAQCPNADFTTPAGIQLAVGAAPPGSVIRVCPGEYSPTTVPKTLALVAPRGQGQATQCMEDVPADPTREAIVDAGNTAAIGLTLAADGIVVDGFTVQNTNGNPGIYTSPLFSGYELRFNTVQQNTFGLYLNASGVLETEVERNCFRQNNRPGAASGNGIYSDQGLRNATVEENFFTDHVTASIVFALNQQDVRIVHNDMVGNASTVALFGSQQVDVAYNHIRGDGASSGVFVGGAVTGTIRFNLIEQVSTGVNVNADVGGNQLAIERNHVRNATVDGIRLDATSGSVVRGNKTDRNVRHGVYLRNLSDANSVRDNLSRDNGLDGIRVDGQSSGNTIERNTALGNGEHDCHDDTVGPGTAATANFWVKNTAKTENRPGLCLRP